MRTEDPLVGVQLVDHHELQVAEEAFPLGMERKQAEVDHVRVGDEDRGDGLADLPAAVAGGVSVVDLRLERNGLLQRLDELLKSLPLVLLQGLQGEEVEGFPLRTLEQSFDHRKVVGQRLPAGRGSGNDHVFPPANFLDGLHLVGIKLPDSHSFQGPGQGRGKVRFGSGANRAFWGGKG